MINFIRIQYDELLIPIDSNIDRFKKVEGEGGGMKPRIP
jgi:hypothetical protein